MTRRAGTIESRGPDTFRIRVFVGLDHETGKRRYVSKTVHGGKRRAEAELRKLLDQKHRGTLAAPCKMTVSQYLKKWLNDLVNPSLKPSTLSFYEAMIIKYIVPHLGGYRLDRLTAFQVQVTVTALADQGLSSRTIRGAVGTLRTAIKTGVRLGMLSHDATLNVELPRHQKAREISILNKDEVTSFISACRGERLGPYFIVALATAARPGEIAALRWRDVDFENCTVSINRSMTRVDGKVVFHAPKTHTSNRTLALSKSVVIILKRHRRRQLEEKLKTGEKWQDHNLVFTDLKGKPLNLPNIRRRDLQKITKKAGIEKKLTLYSLRHTSASLLIANGVDPKTASEVMGHSDVALVLSVYTHPEQESKRYAASVLEDLVFCNVQG